jgi:rubrerythrin
MKEATAKCLRNDFCSGSMAHMRYLIYAQKAREENFPSIARLFSALAVSRYIRASEQYRLVHELIGVHTACSEAHFTFFRTMDNLERARDDEKHEANEVLPAYIAVAESQGEGAASKSLKCSAAVCRHLVALLDDVIQKTKHADEEPKIEQLHVCQACGYIAAEITMGGCPLCGERAKFISVT